MDIDLPAGINFGDLEWFCILSNSSDLCDGVSECLTDECGCHDSEIDVFYCADGSGCIAWSGLCDDIQDCMDGSDECFCAEHVVIPAPEIGGKVCMSEQSFCGTRAYLGLGDKSEVMQMKYCKLAVTTPERDFSPIELCLRNAYEDAINQFTASFNLVQHYCKENCSHVSKFKEGWAVSLYIATR